MRVKIKITVKTIAIDLSIKDHEFFLLSKIIYLMYNFMELFQALVVVGSA